MTINRRSIALGLTVGVLAGGAGGALAATTSGTSSRGASATVSTWAGGGAWGGYGYGPGWSGDDAPGGYANGPGWSGGGAWNGYGEIAGTNLTRTATQAAAAYLDLTTSQLEARLRSGKMLANVATSQHKSVPGLESAIRTAIDKSVQSDGALTADQKATITADAKAWTDAIVNTTCPIGNGFGLDHGPTIPW